MNYNALLELATDLGYRLAMCGAETYLFKECFSSGAKREAICKNRGRILLGQCRKGGRKCLKKKK